MVNPIRRVLIFCPAFGLAPETVDSLLSLDPAGRAVSLLIGGEQVGKNAQQRRVNQYERGRIAALDGGYDAMMTVEADMIIPSNALTLLCETMEGGLPTPERSGADAVAGLYVHRHYPKQGQEIWNPQIHDWPTAFLNLYSWEKPERTERLTPEQITIREAEIRRERGLQDSHVQIRVLDPVMLREETRNRFGKVFEVDAAGLGITLIRRCALSRIPFRYSTTLWDCDIDFWDDLNRSGLRGLLDARVVCGHREPNGDILWPDASGTTQRTTGESGRFYPFGDDSRSLSAGSRAT